MSHGHEEHTNQVSILNKVLEAEKNLELAIEQAKEDAEKMIQDANVQAERLLTQANEEKNKAEQARLEEAKKKSSEKVEVDAQAEKRAAELREKIAANMPKAVARIVQAVLPN